MFPPIKIRSSISDYQVEFLDSLSGVKDIIQQNSSLTIIDSDVKKIHFPEIQSERIISIKSSEDIKNLSFAEHMLFKFDSLNVNQNTKVIIIGGGAMQDSIGYCCSIFKRGIKYILIPTTMLSQADSCVGGKTGLNFNNKKNLIGTFYPPEKILICFDFLKSLPISEKYSGIGEVYKFYTLQNKISDFPSNFLNQETIGHLVYESLQYKSKILFIDEFDKKERKFLNFGHTFGHAIESASNYRLPHGIAVILGVMIATEISLIINGSVPDYDQTISIGKKLVRESANLQKEWFDFQNLLPIIKSDKKNNGQINMVLMTNEGPQLTEINSIEILSSCCAKIYESF